MDNSNVGLGMLSLPSLEDDVRCLEINDVSFSEAKELISQFTAKVLRERPKLKTASDEEAFIAYENFIDDNDENLMPGEIVSRLDRSEIPGSRGRRAVYSSYNGEHILVGTTVVYNKNWATLGVVDPNVVNVLNNLKEEFLD